MDRFVYLGKTRLNQLGDCGVSRKPDGTWHRTEAQEMNVAKVLETILDLRYLASIDPLDAPTEIKERHFETILTRLEELLANDLDGFNGLQRTSFYAVEQNIMYHIADLVSYMGNSESDAETYYDIVDDLAADCATLRAGIYYWMENSWDS
jgi:hypothetical protein